MKFSKPHFFLLSILVIVLIFSIMSGVSISKTEGFKKGSLSNQPQKKILKNNNKISKNNNKISKQNIQKQYQ